MRDGTHLLAAGPPDPGLLPKPGTTLRPPPNRGTRAVSGTTSSSLPNMHGQPASVPLKDCAPIRFGALPLEASRGGGCSCLGLKVSGLWNRRLSCRCHVRWRMCRIAECSYLGSKATAPCGTADLASHRAEPCRPARARPAHAGPYACESLTGWLIWPRWRSGTRGYWSDDRSRTASGRRCADANGRMTSGIVRRGDRLLRPMGSWSPAVHEYLRHLEAAGFEGSPRILGTESDREVLTYIDGDVAMDPLWRPGHGHRLPPYARTGAALRTAAKLIRKLHVASSDFRPTVTCYRFHPYPPTAGEIVSHGDLGRGERLCPSLVQLRHRSPADQGVPHFCWQGKRAWLPLELG